MSVSFKLKHPERGSMTQDQNNLIWLDMEMTGLNPDKDRIIEIAMLVTDSQLNIIAEAPVYVVHQSDAVLDSMDDWNKNTHGKSGLIDKVRISTLDEEEATQQVISFLQHHVPEGISPMCGNTVHQDRRFLARWMPQVESYFHYRNIDVSTLKELAKRWKPEIARGVTKKGKHEALADIIESVEEMRYYRDHFIKL